MKSVDSRSVLAIFLVASLPYWFVTSTAKGASLDGVSSNPSLCVMVEPGCHVPGSRVLATIVLGMTDHQIVGAQFSVQYDPTVLDFLSMSPGKYCDPISPFEFETSKIVDEMNGTIFYAVSIDPFGGGAGTMGPTTVACLEFALLDRSQSSVCLFNGVNPYLTELVDINGHAVEVDNSLSCPSAMPLPMLSCDVAEAASSCVCDETPADCSLLSDQCIEGTCDEASAQCVSENINEGESCDDHDECSTNETCHAGRCFGTDCRNPSLCVVADASCEEDNSARRRVSVQLGEGDRAIVGAQFSVQYDPTVLELIGVSPGASCDEASPFSVEISEMADESTGEVFYAVIVDPFSGDPELGTRGPATLACLDFWLIGITGDRDVCLFGDENPLRTLLAGFESAVPIYNLEDCPTESAAPALSCTEVCVPVPTTSEWGLVIMTILLLTAQKLYFSRLGRKRREPLFTGSVAAS